MSLIVVTGATGFVGQNLVPVLIEQGHEVIALHRDSSLSSYSGLEVDHIFHLAGANRPPKESDFQADNVDYAQQVLQTFLPREFGASSFNYSSTVSVAQDSEYGRSKKAGEELVCALAPGNGWATRIWRLPNLFGKWCRPYYNSFVATFMAQAARSEAFSINDPSSPVELLYIDDCIDMFRTAMQKADSPIVSFVEDFPTYRTTVGDVATMIGRFSSSLATSFLPQVDTELEKKLHATYLSSLEQEARIFALPRFASDTGSFCELFKSDGVGQVSVLTIAPGQTRGNHYHHTKCENFHLVQGEVQLVERDIRGGAILSKIIRTGESFWTRPGWVHALTNTSDNVAVLVIWANEVFDHARTDTIRSDVLL